MEQAEREEKSIRSIFILVKMKISLSETITRMRFPLIVLVVLIHSYDLNRGYCIQGTYFRCNDIIYEKVTYFLTEIVSQIAVPSFFFISGYLFFLKHRKYENLKSFYRHQFKTRIRTILVPFILWNLIAYSYIGLKHLPILHKYFPNVESRDFGVIDFLISCWNCGNGLPIDFPLWYVRDLLVLILISPLIQFILTKTKRLSIIILLILYIAGYKDFFVGDLLFYCAGCYLGLQTRKEIVITKFSVTILCTMFVIFSILDICFYRGFSNNVIVRSNIIHNFAIVFGFFTIPFIIDTFISNIYSIKLSKSVFFIYAFHTIWLSDFEKIIIKYTPPMPYMIH